MGKYPQELKYTKEHEWLKPDAKHYLVGVTDYATEQLGDIVHVELPKVDDEFDAGDTFGVVESVKSVSDIFMPVAAKVVAVNEELFENPSAINEDPYGDGWLVKLEVSDVSAVNELMSAEAYQAFLAEES
ncbi:MAG: hypothetical protein ACD_62C00348G0010 [uncultured bacterium]|nr:MAG: hypothetical protein ACD_62C00348G0010 [uncultured bacterium]HLD43807.1 glycine cleavage system protein GcvH [bacterium]